MVLSAKEFSVRLREATNGESVNSFAKRCEIPEATMRGYFNGKFPPSDLAVRIADVAAVGLVWLLTGHGSKDISTVTSVSDTGPASSATMTNMILVPRFDVQASAGHGAVPQSENIIDSIAFNASWLRERGINPGFASILEARGDSMEPSIRDGDLLVVDRSITTAVGNGIYIVIFGGNVLVKRINMRRDGTLVLISDNERYGQETVPADEVPDIHIAARVMWYGRSI